MIDGPAEFLYRFIVFGMRVPWLTIAVIDLPPCGQKTRTTPKYYEFCMLNRLETADLERIVLMPRRGYSDSVARVGFIDRTHETVRKPFGYLSSS